MTPTLLTTLVILTYGQHVTIIRDLQQHECAEIASVITTNKTIEENTEEQASLTVYLKIA